nr:MAG TPA: hypothetical protein [Bacteriophage sp.]
MRVLVAKLLKFCAYWLPSCLNFARIGCQVA